MNAIYRNIPVHGSCGHMYETGQAGTVQHGYFQDDTRQIQDFAACRLCPDCQFLALRDETPYLAGLPALESVEQERLRYEFLRAVHREPGTWVSHHPVADVSRSIVASAVYFPGKLGEWAAPLREIEELAHPILYMWEQPADAPDRTNKPTAFFYAAQRELCAVALEIAADASKVWSLSVGVYAHVQLNGAGTERIARAVLAAAEAVRPVEALAA